ncbi:MAG TPA: hypothetical protein VF040_01085, partial [Ktedonobacterales bacterium]
TPTPAQASYLAADPQQWADKAQARPQNKSRAGCVVGWLVTLALVICLIGGGFAYIQNRPGGLVIGGVTLGNAHSGPGIIYQDTLDGSTKSDWTNDSNCFFKDSAYHINAGFICYSPADAVGDSVTTVSVKQISGPITRTYGLVIRRNGKGNYYEFGIDGNGKWRFSKVVNGTLTDIVTFTSNSAIKKGLNQVNTLSVSARGSHFVLSINGTQVGIADDSTFKSGKTGLLGYDGIEVVFTNLSIKNVQG